MVLLFGTIVGQKGNQTDMEEKYGEILKAN